MTAADDIARIRSNVLAAVRAVPSGFVTTYDAIAAAQDVTPRHVAFILASVTEGEPSDVPWHRVVMRNGQLDTADAERLNRQKHALVHEGVAVDGEGRIGDFLARLTQILAVSRKETPAPQERH
jgi:methylated-DNA-protein-cysteine methyltransferase related protein